MTEKTGSSRRDLLIGVAALSAVALGWQGYVHRMRAPVIEDIPGQPGWRRVIFDGVTAPGGNATSAVFAGIGAPSAEAIDEVELRCPVLFRDAGVEPVPLAMFTDAFCPYCREMHVRLGLRPETVTWLDLPLLGPASEQAARAAIAAELQGNRRFRERMMTTPFRPTRSTLTALAEDTGASVARLLSDMESPAVSARLKEVRGAAETLGVFGTPGLLVGQILAMGNVTTDMIDMLIEDEKTQPGPRC